MALPPYNSDNQIPYMEKIVNTAAAGDSAINTTYGEDIEILWVRAYQTGTTAAAYISIFDNQKVDAHASSDTNNNHLVFQAAVGPDWVDMTSDVINHAQTLEWVFPKPIIARNGAFILNGTGVVSIVGYRSLSTSTPYDNADGADPTQGSIDEGFKMGEYIRGKRISGSTTNHVLTTDDTEVWGVYIMNNNSTTDKVITLKNGDNQTIASLPVTKVVEEDEGDDISLLSSKLGPINFDNPLIANNGLKISTQSNTQLTVLYRTLGSQDRYPDHI